jgi:hypothetical protein
MITVLKVFGIIWLVSLLAIGIIYLWYKLTGQPFVQDYDGEDF